MASRDGSDTIVLPAHVGFKNSLCRIKNRLLKYPFQQPVMAGHGCPAFGEAEKLMDEFFSLC